MNKQLLNQCQHEAAARTYLEEVRWQGAITCPDCDSVNIYKRVGKRTGSYDCKDCGRYFTVRTGTVLEKSNIPLDKWIHAVSLLMATNKQPNVMQLSVQIKVTPKLAWKILQRVRLACGNDLKKLRNLIDVNKTLPQQSRKTKS